MKVEVIKHEKRSRSVRTRMYFFHERENVMENFVNRRQRDTKAYRELIPEVMKTISHEFDHELIEKLRFQWSQKAGCSCGCSPGFIVEGLYHKDIFVTLGGAE